MTRAWRRALLAAACLIATAPAAPAGPAGDCAVPEDMLRLEASLPHLAARLKAGGAVKVVALGGGSTAGGAAGNPDLAYPRRLQEALGRRFPAARITVLNKGVPRQTAQQMLDRFPRDIIAERPVLVIWEAGISDAVRGVDLEDFAGALETGLARLKALGIDAMLMDMQFSHKTTAVIDFAAYLHTLHRVGDVDGVPVFPRFAMMRYWSEQNMFDFEAVPKEARASLAARVYRCIGLRLADAIAAGVR